MNEPTHDTEMEDLALLDLQRAEESLYHAARRFCIITEKGFIQAASRICAEHDPSFVSIGSAALDLADAGQRYDEAHTRWMKYAPPPGGHHHHDHEGTGTE